MRVLEDALDIQRRNAKRVRLLPLHLGVRARCVGERNAALGCVAALRLRLE